MPQDVLTELCNHFTPRLRWFGGKLNGLPQGWFLLETSPVPADTSDLCNTLADIASGAEVEINRATGEVHHSTSCSTQTHYLDLPFLNAAHKLKRRNFKIAIFVGLPDMPAEKPIAVPISPVISFNEYPDHPHLNLAGETIPGYSFPDNICYIDNFAALDNNFNDRVSSIIRQLSVWLLKHQLWVVMRLTTSPAIWLPPDAEVFPRNFLADRLDPKGSCWCGSRLPYQECHLSRDIQMQSTITGEPVEIIRQLVSQSERRMRHQNDLAVLRGTFLH